MGFVSFVAAFRAVVKERAASAAVEPIEPGRGPALTYRALDDASRRLAARLRALGAAPERLVAVCLDRSPELVIAELAVWRAGAAFVPLDPAYSRERLAFILEDSGAEIVIAREEHRALVEGGGRVIVDPGLLDGSSGVIDLDPDAPALAYVVYTSGSSGHPKGVMVPHRGITNLLSSQIEAFRLAPDKRALFALSPAFDASISDIGTALLSGATLCVAPKDVFESAPRLLALLREGRITHADLPPSILPHVDPAALPPSIETIVIGGEVCPPATVRAFAARTRLVNVYGPTEATVCTSLSVCTPEWSRPLVGRPLPSVRIDVVGPDLERVPPGVAGEILIGGVGLARGYWRRPELTSEKLVEIRGERYYRTGDRGVAREDGEIEFLGRIDRQLKVRGQLVEPAEIEARLLEHPGVLQAAALRRKNESTLVAFVVARPGASAVSASELREHVAARLPRWMVPHRIVSLDALPKTPNGKIDLAALAELELPAPESGAAFRAPRTAREAELARLWRDVLGVDRVGIDDDFFELGGDSLRVVEMIARAGALGLGLLITPRAVYEHRTIARLFESSTAADAMERDEMEREVASELKEIAAPGLGEHADGRWSEVLLTGATGLLGSRLLAELLSRTSARVTCLVRAPDAETARDRLMRAAAGAGLAAPPPDRVIALPGDLAAPRLGLDEAAWVHLARSIDTVIHSGAEVNLVRSYDDLRGANVVGTRNILRLCAEGGPKRLHHVSTLSVFVASDRDRGRMREDDALEDTGRIHGGYAASKWIAERLVRRAHEGGAASPWIYRLGLITPDSSTGLGFGSDLIGAFLRGLASLGAAPEGEPIELDVTPVDFTASALVHMARTAAPGTYHLANARGLSLEEILAAMREAGVPVETVGPEEWLARRNAIRGSDESLAYLALCRRLALDGAFERYRTLDLFQATGTQLAGERTVAALEGSGLFCPAPERALIVSYVRGALGHPIG